MNDDDVSEAASEPGSDSPPDGEPGASTVFDYMLYGLSIPERALRATSAMVGGVARESTELLLPRSFRNSKSYRLFVQQTIDFVVEDLGGVERSADAAPSAAGVENFVAKKAVANFVDLASLATLHMSPLLLLAILSDVAYGSQTYLAEFSSELKKHGVIDENSTIDHATDLLDAVKDASGVSAEAFSIPPLSLQEMKRTIKETSAAVKSMKPTELIPEQEIKRLWEDMRETAKTEDASLLKVSGAMTMYAANRAGKVSRGALATLKVTGVLIDRHVFDHYIDGLKEIRKKGLYVSIAEESKPYVDAVWKNFSADKNTLTEDALSGRLIGRACRAVGRVFSRRKSQAAGEDGAK